MHSELVVNPLDILAEITRISQSLEATGTYTAALTVNDADKVINGTISLLVAGKMQEAGMLIMTSARVINQYTAENGKEYTDLSVTWRKVNWADMLEYFLQEESA